MKYNLRACEKCARQGREVLLSLTWDQGSLCPGLRPLKEGYVLFDIPFIPIFYVVCINGHIDGWNN